MDDTSTAPPSDAGRAGATSEGAPPERGPAGQPSLGKRAARGASTVVVGQAARIVLQIVSVTILARLLDPDDYGLVAIALAVVGVGEIFRDFGLSTAAVQAASLSRHQRDKLFWLNTLIGAGLMVACLLLAPLASLAFSQPDVTDIVRALSATFLLNGLTAQYRADLNRHMRFTALVGSDLGGQFIGVALAVALAVGGLGYWALVAQQLGGSALTLILAVVAARWLPGRPRRGVRVGAMARFGVGLVGSQLIGYLNNNVDTLVIGLRFTPSELGYYNRGYQLLMRPLSQLRAPTTTVALPVLGRLRDDRVRTDAFLVRGQLALGYGLVPVTAFAAGAAAPVVAVFLGDQWGPVAPVFALLAVAGAFQTIAYVAYWVYLSRGLTASLFRYSLVSLAIKVACVLVGSVGGIVGVAAGFALAPALAWPLSLWWVSRLTSVPLRRLYQGAGRILACAIVAAGSTYGVVQATASVHPVLQILAGGVGLAATYALAALAVPQVRRDLVDVLRVGRMALSR